MLKPIYYRNEEQIAIIGPERVIELLKKLPDARWSSVHQCWYIPLTRKHYEALRDAAGPVITIDRSYLKAYLAQRKSLLPLSRSGRLSGSTMKGVIERPLGHENIKAFAAYRSLLFISFSPISPISPII